MNSLIETPCFAYFIVVGHAFPGPGGYAVQSVHGRGRGKGVKTL